jgi:dTDP-4-dehydrorhamnose reductase
VKVVVTGATGQVGAALIKAAPAGCNCVSATRRVCDLADPAAVERFIARERPDWVLNAAAYTAVDRAETERERAFAINAAGAAALARAATACDGRLLHVSTDFVFAGERTEPYRPDSLPGPLNVYGASKLAGERAVLDETAGRALLVRTSWVHSSAGVNFPLRILELLRTRPELKIVDDQIGAPTWARSLAACIWDLVCGPVRHGIHHWCDSGVASWYDFAVAIQEEALERGLLDRPASIQPISTEEYPTAARRPRYSLLDSRATTEAIGRRPEHWRVNLRRMLDELCADTRIRHP